MFNQTSRYKMKSYFHESAVCVFLLLFKNRKWGVLLFKNRKCVGVWLLSKCRIRCILVKDIERVLIYSCNVVLSYETVFTYCRLNTVTKNQLQIYRKYMSLFIKTKFYNKLVVELFMKQL